MPRSTPTVNYLTDIVHADAAVDAVYRADWGRIVASLIRLVRDFDLAEEAAQEAFAASVDQWRVSGVPEVPRAWIIQTARHKAIDRIRRRSRFADELDEYGAAEAGAVVEAPGLDAVLTVIYLIFNEGYAATRGETLVRRDLCAEAIRLGRLVRALMEPQPPAEATALLGSSGDAAKSYERALALVTNDAERRFLDRRLRELRAG